MSFVKNVSKWLEVAGEVKPSSKSFPSKEIFTRWYNMMLEEVNEAVEAADGDTIKECIPILEEKLSKLKEFHQNHPKKKANIHELRDSSADQKVVIANLDHFAGISDVAMSDFEKVMMSNWSKFCETEQEADETVEAYDKGVHPDKVGVSIPADYRQVGNLFVVFNTENGKILKSINYTAPNL